MDRDYDVQAAGKKVIQKGDNDWTLTGKTLEEKRKAKIADGAYNHIRSFVEVSEGKSIENDMQNSCIIIRNKAGKTTL